MNERSFVHEVADRVECDDRRAKVAPALKKA